MINWITFRRLYKKLKQTCLCLISLVCKNIAREMIKKRTEKEIGSQLERETEITREKKTWDRSKKDQTYHLVSGVRWGWQGCLGPMIHQQTVSDGYVCLQRDLLAVAVHDIISCLIFAMSPERCRGLPVSSVDPSGWTLLTSSPALSPTLSGGPFSRVTAFFESLDPSCFITRTTFCLFLYNFCFGSRDRCWRDWAVSVACTSGPPLVWWWGFSCRLRAIIGQGEDREACFKIFPT